MAPSLCPSTPQAAHVGFRVLSLMVRNGAIDMAENSIRDALPSVLMTYLKETSVKGIVHTMQTDENLDGL